MHKVIPSVAWVALSMIFVATACEAADGLHVSCLSSENQPLILSIQNNAEEPDSHVAVRNPKGWSLVQLPSRRFVPYQRACWIGESIIAVRTDGHAFLISHATTDPRATHLGALATGPIAGLQLRNEKRWLLMGAKELIEGGVDYSFGTTKELVRKSIKADLGLQVNSYPKNMTYVEQLDTLFVGCDDGQIAAVENPWATDSSNATARTLLYEGVAGMSMTKDSFEILTWTGDLYRYSKPIKQEAPLTLIISSKSDCHKAVRTKNEAWLMECRMGEHRSIKLLSNNILRDLCAGQNISLICADDTDDSFLIEVDQVIERRSAVDGALVDSFRISELLE